MKIVYCRLFSSFMSLIAQITEKRNNKESRNFVWKFCLIYRLEIYSDLKLGTFFPHSVKFRINHYQDSNFLSSNLGPVVEKNTQVF